MMVEIVWPKPNHFYKLMNGEDDGFAEGAESCIEKKKRFPRTRSTDSLWKTQPLRQSLPRQRTPRSL